jgi:hypothetical protein
MAWDPTDYKDMLDDDWNDRHQELQEMLDDEFFGGVYIDEMRRRAAKILGNPKVIDDQQFEKMVNSQEADIEELAKYLMDNFYLTPIARKKNKMKMQENNSTTTKRGKYVNESLEDELNEDDLELWSEEGEEDEIADSGYEYADHADENMMAEVSQELEILFQEAAEKGLSFEVLQDLAAQALDQVDWVAAGQM